MSTKGRKLFLVVIVPVTVGVPLMVVAVPVSVILVPASFPLGVQIAAPFLRLVATFTVLANRLVELRFRTLDLMLAMGMVICVQLGSGKEHRRAQSCRDRC
jgi:hypothetical protein